MSKKIFSTLLILSMLVVCLSMTTVAAFAKASNELTISTTTSVNDSGLLGKLVPKFEKQYNAKVKVISVGTGQALEIARRGDADVVLVHSKKQETKFINEGYGTKRHIIMCNYFAVVGPKNNPAHIKGYDFSQIMGSIAKTKSPFISRGDKSGTHTKELSLWQEAKINPKGSSWYIEAGAGQGVTLLMANEKKAYTLTDKATFLKFQGDNRLPNLTILIDGGKSLLNVYSVIPVNPNKVKNVNTDLANKFTKFMESKPVQNYIATYGKKEFGKPLFTPRIHMNSSQII